MWLESLRGDRSPVKAGQLFDFKIEEEATGRSQHVSVLTLFLVGAECPFRCTMCDLWRYTLPHPTPVGSIAKQVREGLAHQGHATWIKLYNASNFFDVRSVPLEDLRMIADLVSGFDRVIVENHPKLLKESILEFSSRIDGKLEIAMGLETVEPNSFRFLNKQFTIDDFVLACQWFGEYDIETRAFVMLQPPLSHPRSSVDWLVQSVDFAWENHVRHVSVIPTRMGNGAMESLEKQGLFTPPTAAQLEEAFARCLERNDRGIVTVDLWDWEKLSGHCSDCRERRRQRLEEMNRLQRVAPYPSRNCRCVDLS